MGRNGRKPPNPQWVKPAHGKRPPAPPHHSGSRSPCERSVLGKTFILVVRGLDACGLLGPKPGGVA